MVGYKMSIPDKTKEAPTFGQWVSVDDSLPQVGVTVLTAHYDPTAFRVVRRVGMWEGYVWTMIHELMSYPSEVTHWMSLPDAPIIS